MPTYAATTTVRRFNRSAHAAKLAETVQRKRQYDWKNASSFVRGCRQRPELAAETALATKILDCLVYIPDSNREAGVLHEVLVEMLHLIGLRQIVNR